MVGAARNTSRILLYERRTSEERTYRRWSSWNLAANQRVSQMKSNLIPKMSITKRIMGQKSKIKLRKASRKGYGDRRR